MLKYCFDSLTTCTAPEEEDVEVHPDRVALFAYPDGLQDARVPQLTADQLVLKHCRLLKKKDYQKIKTWGYGPKCFVCFKPEHLPSCCLA